jgi:hypothetical protein
MDIQLLQRQFARIGAELDVNMVPDGNRSFSRNRWQPSPGAQGFVLDVNEQKGQEAFVLSVRKNLSHTLEFLAVDVQPAQRHLLLFHRNLEVGDKSKFLCGHDERHWFVAPVGNVIGVKEAMESLKPPLVQRSQWEQNVREKDRNKRHNDGFIRQGEWFFLPRPRFQPPNLYLVLRNEPLQRAGGKPHWVEEIYRIGGEVVYVCSKYPNGLTEGQYRNLLQRQPAAEKLNWRVMRRNPTVFARGKVRHPDHKTLVLPFWHQVIMSGETRSQNVAFLD